MLDRIVTATRRRLPGIIEREELVRSAADAAGPSRDFAAALTGDGLQVIAEIKRRSPSAGRLAPDLDPAGLARRYEAAGAAAISVLTEPEFFGGSIGDLEEARAAVGLPVLRKDFIVHPVQVSQARAAGADAVLLIVAALDDPTLRDLIVATNAAGMGALVEVHTADEAERALAAGAGMVGVNNRDLGTFRTDLAVAERLAPLLAAAPVRVAESGIRTAADAARMAAAGYHAVLVGESLVRAADPGALIGMLRGAP